MIGKKIIGFMLLALVCFTMQVHGQSVSKTGTTAAKFLSIGVGPRAIGMGTAYSAVAGDASAMYWNPAGIAQITQNEALFTYTKLFADINLNYFGLVLNLGDIGNIGVNVSALNIGEMKVTTELYPDGTGETFSAGSYAVGLSYARYITSEFIVGANLKYIRENIYNSSANGFAFDIGTIFTTPFYGIRFASSISNFGTKMKMSGDDLLVRYDQDNNNTGDNNQLDANLSTDSYELPLRLQIGLARDFQFMDNQRFTLAVDANYPNDNNQWINVGGELALFEEMVSLRGGYKTLFLEDSQEGLTLGFGLKYDKLSGFRINIDYSYQKLEYLDNVHSFGVTLGF